MTAARETLGRLFCSAGQAVGACAHKPPQFVREGQPTIFCIILPNIFESKNGNSKNIATLNNMDVNNQV